ncbi:MAG: hypothetical protein CMH98_01875 [Oceanospirillaceae bacterium]|nr:hypothetical protein [Oceanospirillaceae bacterium]|tara:strand:+ start:43224 stop:45818 length:2595 start_codon:yes stop_codon:yes gene_type:complete
MKTSRLKAGILCATLSGAAFTTAAHAEILINEVDADQASTDTGEFVELYDGGLGNTPLTGYSLVFFNGNNSDTAYQNFDLSAYTTDADGYFVLCGNSSVVTGCDMDVSPDSNLIQNGADAVALYYGTTPQTASTENIIDALVYGTNDSDDTGLLALLNPGQPQVNDTTSESMQRCANGSGGALNTNTYTQAAPTPGAANACGDDPVPDPEPTIGACGSTDQQNFHLISEVQGAISNINNDASPLNGQTVIIEAIVTTDKQGGYLANGEYSYQYSGFWLQEEDTDRDNNAATSEGIQVYDYRDAVEVGDKVRIMGKVSEYNGVTQLGNISDIVICSSDNSLPAATPVTLPVESLTQWEALEGMLVSNNQNLVVSDLYGTGYGFGNYGQFVVSSELHFQGTEIALPESAEALAAVAARELDVVLIDDGVSAAYPEFIPFPDDTGFSAANPMRIGYRVPAVTGVMHAYYENYTIIPSDITIDPVNQRTAEPVIAADANLVIVGMNVLNYFNGDGEGGGFPTSRGAATEEAFDMQSDKIVAALDAMDADIIGLMELENDGFGENSAIQALVNELNAVQAAGDEYSIVDPGTPAIGSDEITVGLIYRAAKVATVGSPVILSSANSPLDDDGNALFIDDKNRPSLIQSLTFNGHTFTVAVNHLKSKGSACNEANEGEDGQGNCNITRTKAAQALVQFLATDPTGSGSDQYMILGDLNAYSKEDPMQVFYDAGYTNLKYTDASTEEQPYSYSYSGFLGSLDHALATDDLSAQVVSVDAWHINSVEDSLMDYQTEANGQSYDSVDNYAAADAYRSSDHDPIVIGVNLPEDNSSPGHGDDDHHGPGHGDHHGEDHNPLKRFLVGLIRWIFSWF